MKHIKKSAFSILLAASLVIGICPAVASAAPPYTRNAELKDAQKYPGVYVVKAVPGDKKGEATIGINSIAKQNLENGPTTESPAIITGGALPYEKKVGPTNFEVIPGGELYEPYSSFRYKILEEQGADGTVHRKMSGFDGTYVIVRVDVSDIIKDAPEGSYLHVKQEKNKAMLVAVGQETKPTAEVAEFVDATGTQAGSYSLANNAAALKDKDGYDKDTPYIDVILISSGTLVQGADTGGQPSEGAPQPDIGLSFYVDQVGDYNPDLVYDPKSTDTNHQANVMAKYYDESKVSAEKITGYTVMGSDLEIEVEVSDTASGGKEYWSLRKAIEHEGYNKKMIKLICEVPGLKTIEVKGSGRDERNVILDLNSFDFQLANHNTTGAAALMVDNATLTLQDKSNTTGAELAVGNNASMMVTNNGCLIVDETCQLEVEYDAASTTTPSTETPSLSNGVLTVKNGGEIVIEGVLTIEGTEGKPIDPAAPAQRDVQNAVLNIDEGGILTIKGCLLINGVIYSKGTINNYGRYNETITSNDPDKGTFTYHKGIQLSWKDDITQKSGNNYSTYGSIYNGLDADGNVYSNAAINNYGDFVLVPGSIRNQAGINNKEGGNIYMAAVEEAVIPITPTTAEPTIAEKRIKFDAPISGEITNLPGSTINNEGNILTAEVEIVSNGRTGNITVPANDKHLAMLDLVTMGKAQNSGTIKVNSVNTFSEFTNSGVIEKQVELRANAEQGLTGKFIDSASPKVSTVHNGVKTSEGDTDIWTYAAAPVLTVTPKTQNGVGGETVKWTVEAASGAVGEDTQYVVYLFQNNPGAPTEVMRFNIEANKPVEVESPVLPNMVGNVVYNFTLALPDMEDAVVSVHVESSEINAPAAIENLVYNGEAQTLITSGGTADGKKLVYSLNGGEYSATLPSATDAGSYSISYKLENGDKEEGTVTAVISKKPVTVSADDLSSKAGDELAELTWTVSGASEKDKFGTVSASTDANKDTAGTYDIVPAVADANENYEITVNNGTYTVTEAEFTVTAKDKYGVYDGVTYFNPDVTVKGTATLYYSETEALNDSNYKTSGKTVAPSIGKPGTTIIYYYATDEKNAISGDTRVIIAKGVQKAPTGLAGTPEEYLGAGNGQITGLKPYETEYRKADNDGTYTLATDNQATVTPGTYLVRMAGSDVFYPSPDAEVKVPEGPAITVEFDSNGGSEVASISGLAFGDTVPRPEDPVLDGYKLAGWKYGEEMFDFTAPVENPMILVAEWKTKALVGDVNDDKVVGAKDKAILNRYLAGWKDYDQKILDWDAADINKDGSVNAKDKAILNRYLAGWKGYDQYFK